MLFLDAIAERRIREAIERGDLDDLPGAGNPLELDEDPLVPPHLRTAYRMLKNAGFVPPEVELRREIRGVEELIRAATTRQECSQGFRNLELLRLRLSESRRGNHLGLEDVYLEKLIERLS
jgi:DnaJ homologue, subfamily C, member 28, conserved domain